MEKKNLFLTILAFVIVALFYFISVSRNLYFEDTSEFITSAYTLGISHPPGYPLYNLLAKLASFIAPLPFSINLFSALSALLSFLIFLIISYKFFNIKQPFLLIFLLASLSTLWDVSTYAEVYSLNLLLFVIQLWALFNMISSSTMHGFFFFISGLSIANHHTAIFPLLYGIYLIFKQKKYKKLPLYLSFFLLGFSVYIYLIIRSKANPYLNWGNPSSLSAFIAHFFRKQYGGLLTNFSLKNLFHDFLQINPMYEISPIFSPSLSPVLFIPNIIIIYLFITGLKSFSPELKNLLIFLIIAYTFIITVIAIPSPEKSFTLKVFYIPGWLLFFTVVFKGVLHLFKNKFLKIMLIIFPVLFFLNFKFHNKYNFHFADDYADNILKSLPYNSLIFTLKDNETFPLWAKQGVFVKRPDVKIINIMLLSELWYIEHIKKIYPDLKITLPYLKGKFNKKEIRTIFLKNLINSNSEIPVFFTTRLYEKFVNTKFKIKPSGIIWTLNTANTNIPLFYLNFIQLENTFIKFLEKIKTLSPVKSLSFSLYLDTQTKYVLQQCAVILWETAKRFYFSGNTDKAFNFTIFSAFLNNIIGVKINNIYHYAMISKIYLSRNEIDKYLYFLNEAVKLQPQTKYARTLLQEKKVIAYKNWQKAENLYKHQKYSLALKYYRIAEELEPDNYIIKASIGDCYFNLRKYRTAIKFYEQAIKINPEYETGYYNLGGCYLMLGEKNKARKIWREGLKRIPSSKLLLNSLKEY